MSLALAVCLVLGQAPDLAGQKKFALTIDSIMQGPSLTGYEPAAVRWSMDSSKIYFQWKQHTDPRNKPMDTWVVNRDGSGLRKLTEEEAKETAPPVFGDTTKDKKLTVFNEEGDIWLYDHTAGKRRRVTRTGDAEIGPRFTKDGQKIVFMRGGNLFAMGVNGGMLEQLTDIRAAGAAPAAAPPAGFGGFGGGQRGGATGGGATTEQQRGTEAQEFIKKEERDLLEYVRERAKLREEREAKQKKENPRKPFNLPPRQSVAQMQLSPDEKLVIATVIEPGDRSKNTVVPAYVTESAFTENLNSRTKVGDAQPRNRVAIISVETGDVKWVDHGQKMTPPPPPAPDPAKPAEAKKEGAEAAPRRPAGPVERPVQLGMPIWSEDGTKAVMMARSADNKDRWVLALDPATGKTRVLVSEHDDAWIDGPGAQTLGWLKDNSRIYYQSEKTGYAHLYTLPFDGGEPKQLTEGKWEVSGVALSEDGKLFYLTSSELSPYERHFYSMPVDGGPRTKLTRETGGHRVVLSPDEKAMADLFSYTNKPTELFVRSASGDGGKQVTTSPSPEFFEYAWQDVPIVEIPARDGAKVPARMYKPANWKKGGPLVLFVHGAGYLQNVHKWWSSYGQSYMFHHLLMEKGYLVLDVDYRASAGYGRDWRTAIYRHMGGKDLDDHVDAVKWAVAEQGVDPKRVGLYGGSYGGFITLMAMFTQPDVFAAGASLRPVTDWAHYNHPYTSNILNEPQKDAEAYRRSSPIYHAQNLKGALLICHGMVDVNVHFQDTVRLVQRLIELRKENWELAVYPVEDHGFVEPSSWADEFKRIFKLFETNLKPVAAVPSPAPVKARSTSSGR